MCAAGLLVLASTGSAQSVWKDNGVSMMSDKRARSIGDIVTILVQESSTAAKDNTLSTSKKTSMDASLNTFLYSPGASGFLTKGGQMPAINYTMNNPYTAGGKINNSEKITARIAVRVAEVLPNGNLVLEGTKKTSFAGETQDAVLRGVVRPEDISANGTVFSYNVADATIKYVSKGSISNTQRKGWFTKIWDRITPF